MVLSIFVVPFGQRYIEFANSRAAERNAQATLSDIKYSSLAIKTLVSGLPVKIVIPSVGIDIPVVDGYYFPHSTNWSVALTKANYDISTPAPNNKHGTTYIYGHWSPQVFGPTAKMIPGNLAYVYTSNNHIFSYKFEYKKVTRETDSAVLADFSKKPGLVLMTCQGMWAQNRRFMYFTFVSVN